MSDRYDKHLRERLLRANVKAPEGAWEAISERIGITDVKPSGRSHSAWWGVGAVLCSSFAALALVFFHERHESVSAPVDKDFIVASSVDRRLACEDGVFGGQVRRLREDFIPREFFDESLSDSVPVESSAESKPENISVVHEEFDGEASEWEDPFASLMTEDMRNAAQTLQKKPSFRIRGSVGANDAHSETAFSGAQWTSGYTPLGMQETSVSTYSIPVSMGLSVAFPISRRFSYSVGLDWTLLTRYFQGAYNTMEGEVSHYVHYIGVPLNLYYTFNPWSNFKLYSFAGISLEKCLSSKYYIFSESSVPVYSDKNADFQLGLKAGFGISLRISGKAALFFDPYVGYYLSESQPKSIRTEHPLMMSFDFGLRLNL